MDGIFHRRLISIVSAAAAAHLASYKGFDNTGDDKGLHNTIRIIQSGQKTDIDSLIQTYRTLTYPMTQMSTTDVYLRIMGLAPPKGQRCAEYDIKRNRTEIEKDKSHSIERPIFDRRVLFPRPVEGQGRPFYKGIDYMIAALHGASIGRDEIIMKPDGLAAKPDQALEQQVEEVVRWDPGRDG